jgi:tetratricopeptide (TPR) repeat protein
MRATAGLALLLAGAFAVGAAAPAARAPARRPAPPAASAPPPAPRPALRPAPPADPIRAEFDEALAPGLGDSTAARLGRFLAVHPHHPLAPHAQFELGTLAYARGEYGDARERFKRARAAELDDEARYWEGLSAFALGRPRDAREAVLPAARAKHDAPRRWDSAYLVALSWAQEGRRPEALAAYRTLLDLPAGPAQAAALYQAQRLAAGLSRADDAAEWGKRLLSAYPNSPEAASFRAETAKPAAPPAATPDAAPGAGKSAPGAKPGTLPAKAALPPGGGR